MLAALVFVATYAVIAFGRLPGARLDRAGAALLGASLMVATGALSLEEAYRAIDLDTITLLLGMMIVVANLRFSGFFGLAALGIARHARHPVVLLAGTVAVAGVLSAFFVNDTVCLMLTPLVAEAVVTLGRNPLPYLLAVAMASNIGSVATITGNPQNIMIGSVSHIAYDDFAAALAPVAAAGLGVAVVLLILAFPREFLTRARLAPAAIRVRSNRVLLAKSLLAAAAMVALFFLGQPPAKVAIVVGALLLVTRRIKPARIYAEIDWALLLMFGGLFILVAGIEKTLLTPQASAELAALGLGSPVVLVTVAALLSNVVSNVPAVLVLKPFVASLGDARTGWLLLAMGATLAGNLTLLGSIANLIVAERARRHGMVIGFWSHFRVGAPVTIATLALGLWLLR